VPDVVVSGTPHALPAPGSIESVGWKGFAALVRGQRGRVVVVNVWASWCTPCRAEAPTVERLSNAIRPDAQMLGVVSQDDRDSAARFVSEFGLTFPNVIDGSGEVTKGLRMQGFPTTYVFDARGRLRSMIFGGISEQRLAAAIQDASTP
jgi:cytochrome c biogenesis protein CcmG/thiol:disulfide interchange protein DsbE